MGQPLKEGAFMWEELCAIRDQLQVVLQLQLSELAQKKAEMKKEREASIQRMEEKEVYLAVKDKDVKRREVEVSQREALAEKLMLTLDKRESSLKKREGLLLEIEQSVAACHVSIEECIEQKVQENVKCNELLASELETIKKDNLRLKESFTSVCRINEKLKKQLGKEQLVSGSMQQRISSLQGRLFCLKQDIGTRCKHNTGTQQENCTKSGKKDMEKSGKEVRKEREQGKVLVRHQQELMELAHHLMQWATEVLFGGATALGGASPGALCTATFPLLAVLLPTIPHHYHHGSLQFICRTVLCTSSKTKNLLNSSLRRIGEVCAASLLGKGKLSQSTGVFCGSSDIRIRVLSDLVTLQTITQVNALSLALQNLKCDLRQTEAQDDFISFGGIQALLVYFKPSSKVQVLCWTVLDIFMLLASDSGLTYFLNNEWFNAVATLLKDDSIPSEELEKLSILLQRLSTIRRSKTMFCKAEIVPTLHRLTARKTLATFIQLNISSTLNNLDI